LYVWQEFSLVEVKELTPMNELIEQLLDKDRRKEERSAAVTSGAVPDES
jgi:hypothetical protein